MTEYIIDEKGLEVISEIHQKDYKKEDNTNSEKSEQVEEEKNEKENFTDVNFDDI